MAKKSAHGKQIGQIDFLTYSKAYMEDGTILKNSGFGWKVFASAKPGVNITDVYNKSLQHQQEMLSKNPAYAAYRRELHKLTGLSKRYRLHYSVRANPQDPDGVWSDVCPGYHDDVSASPEEIDYLCNLYLALEAEVKAEKA